MRRLKAYVHIQEEGGGGVGTYFKGNLNVENLFSKKQDNLIVTVMFAITGDLPPLQIIMKIEYFYKVSLFSLLVLSPNFMECAIKHKIFGFSHVFHRLEFAQRDMGWAH